MIEERRESAANLVRRRPADSSPELRLAGDGRPDANWNDLIIICAANPWDGMKLTDQHLAERLAAFSPVLYVDPPLSRLTPRLHPELAASLEGPRLRVVAPSLARLTPIVLPGPLRPGMIWLTTRMFRRAVRSAAITLGGSVRAVVGMSTLLNPFGVCGERLAVYWATDDFVAGAEAFGLSAGRIRRGERRVAASADLVMAVSPAAAQTWRDRGCRTVMMPNGCDAGLFARTDEAPPPTDVGLAPPIAGFIGHLGDRIDMSLLEAVADRGRSLLLVGPRHPKLQLDRLQRLLARPNVQWVGPKQFDELPSYQRVIDVGLVPYASSAFNRGSFPLKTLEYLAAGRPVVATDLPAIRWLETELVRVASEPMAFADAVDQALEEPRTVGLVGRRRSFAATHDWTVRAQEFARVLGLLPERAGAVAPSVPWT